MRQKLLICILVLFGITALLFSQTAATKAPVLDRNALVTFLLKAKKATYASQGDAASVQKTLLPGTYQLEFAEGPFLYRDIYTGEAMFAGQEIVYFHGKPVWTMSYAGNIPKEVAKEDVDAVVKLLHKSLMNVPAEIPYRGPLELKDGAYEYFNHVDGTFDSFFGRETIGRSGRIFYELRYGGGLLR